MTHRELVEHWFEHLYTPRGKALIDEMVAPGCEIAGLPKALHGPAGFRLFYDMLAPAFAKIRVVVDDAVEQGDRIAVRCTATLEGHDGKTHVISGAAIVRVKNGQFVEASNHFDFLTLMVSLGHVAESAFPGALATQTALAAR